VPDGLPPLARRLARCLPARTREQCFVPTCHDLFASHLLEGARPTWWRRLSARLMLPARLLAAYAECLGIAANDVRRSRRAGPSGRRGDPMLFQDVRFAGRLLRKHPAFTAVAVVVLALGVGATSAMFTIVHAVMLRPLPFRDPGHVLELYETVEGSLTTLSPPNLLDWKAQNVTFSGIAAYDEGTVTLTGGFEPERVSATRVDPELFDLLGVAPVRGRAVTADDANPGGPSVVVIGHGFWQRRFGADESALGRTLTLDGRSVEVVGIMPRGFTFPEDNNLWLPLWFTGDELRPGQRGAHYARAIGRLKPGLTVQQAIDDLNRIEARIAEQHPSVEGYGAWARPVLQAMVGRVQRPLLMLLGAVGFVLLIACANVSNLLLARASARRAEIAMRSALGAGRGRIVRQLLVESLLLACAGGIAGLLLAAWGVRTLQAILPGDLPRAGALGVNTTVLVFTLAVSMTAGIVFGLVPAFHASSGDLASVLKDARRGSGSGAGRLAFQRSMVAVQVALALILLAGAGLALRSFDRLTRIDPGFDPSNAMAVRLSLPEARYPDAASVVRFYEHFVGALRELPGVEAAGAVTRSPLSGSFAGSFTIPGRPDADDRVAQVRAATPGYFDALRIPVRRGRTFEARDRAGAAPVAIISESAARRFWPGRDPLGERLRIHVSTGFAGPEPVRTIVGVAGDVKLRSLDAAATPVFYVPHSQYVSDSMTAFVRAVGDPGPLAPMIRGRVANLDPELAISSLRPAADLVSSSIAQPRFRMLLLGLFAAIALALAAVGLYGVMAFAVAQRRHEIGVRLALGADRPDVLRLVFRQGLVPVAAGVAMGLAGTAVLTRAMSGLLYEVRAFDPVTYAAVAGLLAAVSALACYLPARRAMRVDPVEVFRA